MVRRLSWEMSPNLTQLLPKVTSGPVALVSECGQFRRMYAGLLEPPDPDPDPEPDPDPDPDPDPSPVGPSAWAEMGWNVRTT
eukprot:3880306-Rhodomonas_salina.1